jgi:hypothetical protein
MSASAVTPDGATWVGDWETYDGAGGLQARSVKWSEHDVGNVAVDGRQWPDGTVDASVSLYVGDGAELNAGQARQLAAALLDAADALDDISRSEPPA